ncbi:tyrosine-type recombinase/integrase [Deinococcus sp. SM5_A1]|uniref:tyrosine-type recombinase/integrase n=1 Tax=Deinococcus sp. SM5_A1 TaxID=3379094 RepID=UPI00385FA1E4
MTTEGEEKKERRGHGEVNVTQLPSGSWRWRVWVKLGGKSKRLTGTEKTKTQARSAGHRIRVDAERGKVPTNRTLTLGDHLAAWLRSLSGVSASTRKKYGDLLRLHILPGMGFLKLAAVDVAALRAFYGTLWTDETEKKGVTKNLGYSSRRQIHNILHAALDQAAADGLIPGNPAAIRGLRPVQAVRDETRFRAFTPEQAARFVAVADAEGERPAQVLAFLMLTGLRRGEALGLRWTAVNLSKTPPEFRVELQRTVSGSKVIEGVPKTNSSRRTVPLSPEAVKLLERVHKRTDEEREALYPGNPPSPYVFPSLKGTGYDPSNFTRVMQRICAAADVPVLSVHELRHTYASLAALRGTSLAVLSKFLGHSDPAFTLRQYRHLYPEELVAVSLDLPPVPAKEAKEKKDEEAMRLLPAASASISSAGRKNMRLKA